MHALASVSACVERNVFTHKVLIVVGHIGLEPTANGLRGADLNGPGAPSNGESKR